MNVDATTHAAPRAERRSARVAGIMGIAPLVALAGVVWAIAQPYRLTLLDARNHDFWDLLVQPPLLVVLVAVAFHLAVARPLVADLEDEP